MIQKFSFDRMLLVILLSSVFYAGTTTSESDDGFGQSTTTPFFVSDYDYEYDYSSQFKPGTPFCEDKSTCPSGRNVGFPAKNCYCDPTCHVLEDCCPGHLTVTSDSQQTTPPAEVFSCITMKEVNRKFGLYFVTKCPKGWTESRTRALCENKSPSDDILLNIPVTDATNDVTFRNMYCAQCNSVFEVLYWKPLLTCNNNTQCSDKEKIEGYGYCYTEYIPPSFSIDYRKCPLRDVVASCPNDIGPVRSALCSRGNYSLVYHRSAIYRNADCARCNLVPEEDILCESMEIVTAFPPPDICARSSVSFRMLVDFNSGLSTITRQNEIGGTGDSETVSKTCSDHEIYDPFKDRCREIFCIPPLVANQGKCVGSNASSNLTTESDRLKCTLIKLDPHEYRLINDSQIFILSSQKIYNETNFLQHGNDVFICFNGSKATESSFEPAVMFQFDQVEFYMSVVGVTVSLVALTLNFIVYVIFHQLRNTPGKILLCLISSLFVAQLLFLIAPPSYDYRNVCFILAVLMHYAFLAAFCWMDIIAVDLWMTFSKQYIASGSGGKSSKRWYIYNIYAWLLPAAIVIAACVCNFIDGGESFSLIKPRYAEAACWISSKYGLIVFFVGPLAFFKLFDLVAFVATARHIYIAKKHSALVRDKKDSSLFWVYLKLSLVMGLTWAFAFIANLANVQILWYLFIIFNTLQGLFICLSFVFTKKVIRLIREKWQDLAFIKTRTGTEQISSGAMSQSTTAPTQLSTLSGDTAEHRL